MAATDAATETIADVGELALIERIKPYCAAGAIGDDAAVLATNANHQLVVTTDILIEAVHFSDRTTPPYSVGWRAVAANLSDLAAMGAQPLAITVGLGLPSHTTLIWIEELYRGMSDCLAKYGGAIVGGDFCRSRDRTVSVTALGEAQPMQIIRRDTARPGMSVVVTGTHGASRAGLALLLEELVLSENDSSQADDWIRAHQLPVPRFDAIAALRQIVQSQIVQSQRPQVESTYSVIAGMDSSDGLANALLQLSNSSGIGMDIARSQLPLPPGLSTAVGSKTAVDWALYGGEDFELVLCMPPPLAETFTQTSFGIAIGTTTNTGIVSLRPTPNSRKNGVAVTHKGFQHF